MPFLNRTTYIFLYFLLFSPLLSYLSYGRFVTWTLLSYTVLFAIIYGLVFFIIKYHRIYLPNFIVFFLLWVFYFSLSGVLVAFEGDWIRIFNNHYLAIFFMLIIIYNTHFTLKFIENTIKIFKITVIIAAIVSIIQVFDSSFMNPMEYLMPGSSVLLDDIYRFRRASIFGFIEVNALGLAFMPLLSTLIGYMLLKKEKGYFIYLILGGLVALLSNSRYIMIGFIIITFQILVFNKVKIIGIVKYFIIAIVAYFVLVKSLLFLGYNFQDWYDLRLFAEGSLTETSRYKAIGTFIKYFPQTPFFGTGGIMTTEILATSAKVGSSHIHVGYLSHLVAYGIVGCFFLYGFWGLLVKKLYRSAKHTHYWGSFFAFLVFFFAFATMSESSIFYYGLIFALVFDKYFSDKANAEYLRKHQKTCKL